MNTGTQIRRSADFSLKAWQEKRLWSNIFKVLSKKSGHMSFIPSENMFQN